VENAHLIVGLGNPGRDYVGTRHNAGFLLVEKLATRWQARWEESTRFRGRLARVERPGGPVLLCQPLTFMNASGESVGAVSTFYKVPPERVLVVVDDADLPLGEVRLRPGGGTGGHHGLESVQQHLGTPQFPRLRIGIAPGPCSEGPREITGHVLGSFAGNEREWLGRVLDHAAAQSECWLDAGIARAMNDYNGAVAAPENERQ
jgi:peptidyl-tRNA hydrolase, PTH1 family